MQFHSNSKLSAKDIAVLSMFLAGALIMGLVERMIPFDFIVPGVKLGLANVVILTAIYLFDFPKMLILVALKCVVLMLMTGSVSSFLYSLSGSLLSFLTMWILVKISGKGPRISPVGVSVVGAVFHNIGQILAASYIMGSYGVAAYLPALIVSGVMTGIFVGLTVNCLLPYIKKLKNIKYI